MMKMESSPVVAMAFLILLIFPAFSSPLPASAAEGPKADEFKAFEGTWVGEIEFAKTDITSGDTKSVVLTVSEVCGI